jgi:ABC-type Fe3+ transport system permease subunit
MRQFGLSLAVALLTVVAVGAWFSAGSLYWEWLFTGPPTAGAYGTSVLDIRTETHTEEQTRVRRHRTLATQIWWSVRVSCVSAALSLLGALTLAWRARRDPIRSQILCGVGVSVTLAVFLFVVVG